MGRRSVFRIHMSKRKIMDETQLQTKNVPVSVIKVETRCSLLGNHFYKKLSGLVCHDFPVIKPPVSRPPLVHTHSFLPFYTSPL